MKFLVLKIVFLFLFLFLEAHSWEKAFLDKVKRGERPAWMIEQITQDLQPFTEKGITKKDLDDVLKVGSGWLMRFEVKDNTYNILHVQESIYYNEQRLTLKTALARLAELVSLPYIDFIIDVDDATHMRPEFNSSIGPIFTFGKLKEAKGPILFPDWEVLNSIFQCQKYSLSYSDAIKQVTQARMSLPWREKLDKAFWRGHNTGVVLEDDQTIEMNMQTFRLFPRNNLVSYSLMHPNFLDARFNFICQGSEELRSFFDSNGYLGNGASIFEHLKYKYQILADGHSCSWAGAYWRFFANSVILKQTSPAMQWYYGVLKPYVHYIPVAHDFSDLEEKMQWARTHEKEVKRIIINANNMAKQVLRYEDIMLYIYLLLTEYAKLQRF